MVQMEEKIRALREAGITEAADFYVKQEKMLSEIKALTDMKFKITTIAEVRKKMPWFRYEIYPENVIAGGFMSALFVGAVNATTWMFFGPTAHLVGYALCAVELGIAGWFATHESVQMDWAPIKNWSRPIPYGAALAVSEARQIGIDEFRIYFPVKVQKDPVIVGYTKSGVLVEVFAWDDGVIYE